MQLSKPFVKLNTSLGHLQRHFRSAFRRFLYGFLALLRFLRVPLRQFERCHHRVIGSRVSVDRLGKFVRNAPHFVQRRRKLIHKSRLRFLFPRKSRNHLPQCSCERSSIGGDASSARSSRGRCHRLQKRQRQSRQLPVFRNIHRRAAQCSRQFIFKHLGGREVLQLQEKVRRHLDRFFWHQSDDFASHRHHAVALRFALHHFINAV